MVADHFQNYKNYTSNAWTYDCSSARRAIYTTTTTFRGLSLRGSKKLLELQLCVLSLVPEARLLAILHVLPTHQIQIQIGAIGSNVGRNGP